MLLTQHHGLLVHRIQAVSMKVLPISCPKYIIFNQHHLLSLQAYFIIILDWSCLNKLIDFDKSNPPNTGFIRKIKINVSLKYQSC